MHAFINDLERPVGTYLYGRRLYDVMAFWETMEDDEPVMRDYAQIWKAAEKVVYSRSLDAVRSERTRLEREFDPGAVRALVEEAPTDVSIGGAELAGVALRAGLIAECHLFVVPAIVGGGTRALPDDCRLDLELVAEQRFGNGTVHLHHRIR